jgi:signal transduction histidine kinase
VLLDDAQAQHLFSQDPYFRKAAHRSVLCKPIARQGRFVGLFYLENDLVTGAFDPERLAVLEVLASQTAISIENSRLYEASRAAVVVRDEFLAIASHELKTPLTPITLQLQSLLAMVRKGTLKDATPERLAKLVSTCDAQLARLTRLIEALLDVSRIGSGKLALDRKPIDLGLLVADAAERHGTELAAAGCPLDLRVAEGVVGPWDRDRLEQVVTNLLLTAMKFGRRKPIALRVTRDGDTAVFVVEDQGVGIGERDKARIFERFERIQSKTNVDGLGLGLFIVRAIVEAHGGTIGVEGRVGEGATFRVELPIGGDGSG